MPLTNNATYEEVVAKLQDLTGINQKSELVGVIGNPASNGEAYAQLVSHISNSKNKMATNLKSKKIQADSSESLDSLATKIGSIPLNKKKYEQTFTPPSSGSREEIISLGFNIGFASIHTPSEGWSSLMYSPYQGNLQYNGGGSYNGGIQAVNSTTLKITLYALGGRYTVIAYES